MSGQQKILVVDDEPLNIQVLTGLLKSDYKLLVAKNGERALQLAASAQPDLMLLDIMMPEMDGYQVCRRLKARPATRDIPVIFITAMGEVEDETKGLELGAVDYIRKPISPPILRARVRTQLALVQQQRELKATYAVIKSQRDRMEEELNIGREIQLSMMPLELPNNAAERRFSLSARLEAARELGGDFYDFYFLNESLLLMCVGDVSDKGVPAALFAAVAKTLIQSHAEDTKTTGEILTQVNEVLSRDNGHNMFVTLFLAICNVRTGELVYTNAGHNPPYIRGATGETQRLSRRHGPVVGAMQGMNYGEHRARLHPGECLLLYTDGVTEAVSPNGELFSEERLVALLDAQTGAGAAAVVDSVLAGVRTFEGGAEQADDITLLVFEYHGVDDTDTRFAVETRRWPHLTSTQEVIEWVKQFLKNNDLGDSLSRRLSLVIDDLLSNIIAYAYEGREGGPVEIGLQLKGGRLTVELVDEGVAFDPAAAEPPDLDAPIDERQIGGLGIHLVRNIMDDISYERRDENNVLRLSVAVG